MTDDNMLPTFESMMKSASSKKSITPYDAYFVKAYVPMLDRVKNRYLQYQKDMERGNYHPRLNPIRRIYDENGELTGDVTSQYRNTRRSPGGNAQTTSDGRLVGQGKTSITRGNLKQDLKNGLAEIYGYDALGRPLLYYPEKGQTKVMQDSMVDRVGENGINMDLEYAYDLWTHFGGDPEDEEGFFNFYANDYQDYKHVKSATPGKDNGVDEDAMIKERNEKLIPEIESKFHAMTTKDSPEYQAVMDKLMKDNNVTPELLDAKPYLWENLERGVREYARDSLLKEYGTDASETISRLMNEGNPQPIQEQLKEQGMPLKERRAKLTYNPKAAEAAEKAYEHQDNVAMELEKLRNDPSIKERLRIKKEDPDNPNGLEEKELPSIAEGAVRQKERQIAEQKAAAAQEREDARKEKAEQERKQKVELNNAIEEKRSGRETLGKMASASLKGNEEAQDDVAFMDSLIGNFDPIDNSGWADVFTPEAVERVNNIYGKMNEKYNRNYPQALGKLNAYVDKGSFIPQALIDAYESVPDMDDEGKPTGGTRMARKSGYVMPAPNDIKSNQFKNLLTTLGNAIRWTPERAGDVVTAKQMISDGMKAEKAPENQKILQRDEEDKGFAGTGGGKPAERTQFSNRTQPTKADIAREKRLQANGANGQNLSATEGVRTARNEGSRAVEHKTFRNDKQDKQEIRDEKRKAQKKTENEDAKGVRDSKIHPNLGAKGKSNEQESGNTENSTENKTEDVAKSMNRPFGEMLDETFRKNHGPTNYPPMTEAQMMRDPYRHVNMVGSESKPIDMLNIYDPEVITNGEGISVKNAKDVGPSIKKSELPTFSELKEEGGFEKGLRDWWDSRQAVKRLVADAQAANPTGKMVPQEVEMAGLTPGAKVTRTVYVREPPVESPSEDDDVDYDGGLEEAYYPDPVPSPHPPVPAPIREPSPTGYVDGARDHKPTDDVKPSAPEPQKNTLPDMDKMTLPELEKYYEGMRRDYEGSNAEDQKKMRGLFKDIEGTLRTRRGSLPTPNISPASESKKDMGNEPSAPQPKLQSKEKPETSSHDEPVAPVQEKSTPKQTTIDGSEWKVNAVKKEQAARENLGRAMFGSTGDEVTGNALIMKSFDEMMADANPDKYFSKTVEGAQDPNIPPEGGEHQIPEAALEDLKTSNDDGN